MVGVGVGAWAAWVGWRGNDVERVKVRAHRADNVQRVVK